MPEFAGQRAPFGRGHELSTTHGARSERRLLPLAREHVAALLADPQTPSYLSDPSYGRSLLAYGRAEAVCDLLAGWLSEQSVEDALSEVTKSSERSEQEGGRGKRLTVSRRTASVIDQLAKWEKVAAHLRSDLALPPLSRARVARDLGLAVRSQAEAVAALAERGRGIRERREAGLPAGASEGAAYSAGA